jgi:hypothetical protein
MLYVVCPSPSAPGPSDAPAQWHHYRPDAAGYKQFLQVGRAKASAYFTISL